MVASHNETAEWIALGLGFISGLIACAMLYIAYHRGVGAIIRKRRVEDGLATLAKDMDIALDNIRQGICVYDADERLVLANHRVAEIYGLDADSLRPGMRYREVLALARRHLGSAVNEAELAARTAYRLHVNFMQDADGGAIITEYPDGLVLSVLERPLPGGGWVSTFEDISERHHSERRLQHMARHDMLTGLPNREQFREYAAGCIASDEARGTRLVLASIDVDHLEDVNDMHGHHVADELLREIAVRIDALLQGGGLAARVGGDEFAVLSAVSSSEEADALGVRLARELNGSFNLAGHAIPSGVSIGLAVYPEDGASYEELAANAVLALHRAKRTPHAKVCRYRSERDEKARERRALEGDLRDALERGQLHLAYQVQCLVQTGEPVGYEALLRWNHPQRGAVPPDRFIPIAEETGLILPIGEWVLRQACGAAARWNNGCKVAVNISAVQLVQGNLPALVTEALLESGLSPSRLEIEITESAIISDKLRALHNLRLIKALGVSVAIDDFGTGYASLDTLHSFEFDKIKIDRSFLMDFSHRPKARAIIRAVLALGKSLELPVLAEGVETGEHLQFLREEGCAEAQGFYLGHAGVVEDQPVSLELSGGQ